MSTPATAPSGAPGAPPIVVRQSDSYVVPAMNEKGGSGKTFLMMALAAHTAAANGRALLADVDPQANAHDLTKALTDPGYHVIHELNPKQLAHLRQARGYDGIFVDTPGSLEGKDVLDEILKHSTFVLIPYPHKPEALAPTVRTARKIQSAGVPYAAVVTLADPRLGAPWVEDAWRTLDKLRIPHFRSYIREYRAWPNSLQAGIPITRWNARYAPLVREDIARLHGELLLNIGRLTPAGRP
jgi:chromosome partitioning protein